MISEMIFTIKSLTTNITSKGSRLAMYETVAHEFKFRIKSLVAQITRKGKLTSMGENVLAELAGAGEALVAGGADMTLAAVARAALGRGTAAGRGSAAGRAARLGLLGRQCGHSPGELDGTEGVLNTAACTTTGDEFQLCGQLRGGGRYERLLRGGRTLAARLLRELGTALLAFSWVR